METKKSLVENYWSKVDCSASEKNFYCFPPIRSRSCKLIFDEVDARRRDWCEYWTVEKYLKDRIPFEKCLSICCGFGLVERILSKLNVAKEIVGTDLAPGAIEKAKKRAEQENIHNIKYYVGDLNEDTIPEAEYDLIWANGALHHIEDLDNVIPMLYRALKPKGFLISNEYVGPKYQQVGKRQQELINAVKHILPSELTDKNNDDIYNQIWHKIPEEDFIKKDPSECVNSNNIIPVLKKTFDEVEVRYFNGSILTHILDKKFYDNYDPQNANHVKLLKTIFEIEDTLIETGEIGSDNAHMICMKA